MNQLHYNQEKSPKRTPVNAARKAFWDAALGDNSKLANLAKAAITEAEQQAKAREWVGLTDEDRQDAFNSMPDMLEGFLKTWGWLHFSKAIESKLREKNAGLPAAVPDDIPAILKKQAS